MWSEKLKTLTNNIQSYKHHLERRQIKDQIHKSSRATAWRQTWINALQIYGAKITKLGRSYLLWSHLCGPITSMQQFRVTALGHACWYIDALCWYVIPLTWSFYVLLTRTSECPGKVLSPKVQSHMDCSASPSSHYFLRPCASNTVI